jgi:hypothetical protein
MDIISHGLWGGIAVGRKSRRDWWTSFAFSVAPDALSFGIFTVLAVLGLSAHPDWQSSAPDLSLIPAYVSVLYDITHSLVTFFVAFGIVWLIRRKPYLPMLAWAFHIILDIFTHSVEFFPTPYLWPFPFSPVDGISWGHPYIWYPNVALLAILYGAWYLVRRRERRRTG